MPKAIKNFKTRIARNPKLFSQFEARLQLFLTRIRGAPINDHALTGTMAGQRALSVSADIRVIYVEAETEIILLDIGTHNQVYGG